ncbi:MAG: hypothetical protein EOP54_14315 [Sphingobacteriales bacterium]|nr:MAG: hypothetical protein EOP54_14315 [Sphingobacteriales bacterium]
MFHYIKYGDTLAGLATEIGLENPVYLKEYNNAQCLPADLITEELEPGKRVLLPKLTEIEQYNALKDAPFRLPQANPKLEWKADLAERNYQIKVDNSIEGSATGSFQYEAKLQLRKSGYDYRQLNWFRTNYHFDKATKMSQLAKACSEAINPLLITIDDKGILQEITVDKAVLEKWPELQAALCDAFPDPYAAAYIEDLAYVLQQPHLVNRRMRQDPFIRTYFAPLRVPFDKGFSFFSLQLIPAMPPLRIQQVVATTAYTDTIPLVQSMLDNTANDQGLYYEGKYLLDRQDGSIRSAAVHTHVFHKYRQHETYIKLEEQA